MYRRLSVNFDLNKKSICLTVGDHAFCTACRPSSLIVFTTENLFMNNMVLPSSIRQNAITDASAWEPQDLQTAQPWSVSLTAEQDYDLLT